MLKTLVHISFESVSRIILGSPFGFFACLFFFFTQFKKDYLFFNLFISKRQQALKERIVFSNSEREKQYVFDIERSYLESAHKWHADINPELQKLLPDLDAALEKNKTFVSDNDRKFDDYRQSCKAEKAATDEQEERREQFILLHFLGVKSISEESIKKARIKVLKELRGTGSFEWARGHVESIRENIDSLKGEYSKVNEVTMRVWIARMTAQNRSDLEKIAETAGKK